VAAAVDLGIMELQPYNMLGPLGPYNMLGPLLSYLHLADLPVQRSNKYDG